MDTLVAWLPNLMGGLPIVIPVILLAVAASRQVGLNREYERAVVFRIGRLAPIRGPGLYFLVPLLDRAVKVDLRVRTYALATQETVTRDGVAVKINAVLWVRPDDPARVVIAVQNWEEAVVQAAETALRDAIGQSDLDQLLKERLQINARLLDLLGRTVSGWGVAIDAVEIKDLDIPEQMQRAIAREAEAIRERRARIIKAEGEREAGRTLAEAAALMEGAPAALELRRLQTISEIGAEHNSTVVTMVPTELLSALRAVGGRA